MPHNKSLDLQCFATPWIILFCPSSLLVSLPLSPMLTVSHVPSAQLMADIGLKSPTTPMLVLSNRLKHWDFLSLTVDMFASKRNPSHLFSITSCFSMTKDHYKIRAQGKKTRLLVFNSFWYHKVYFLSDPCCTEDKHAWDANRSALEIDYLH